MPGIIDKIIINHGQTRGMAEAINHELATLETLATEIERDWLQDAQPLRAQMIAICTAHHTADVLYYDGLRKLRDDLAAFIDDKLGLKP